MDDRGTPAGMPADSSSSIALEPAAPEPPRRRRLVAAVGAAMLVTAAGGVGFGIGRSVAPSDDTVSGSEDVVPAVTDAPVAMSTVPAATADSAPPAEGRTVATTLPPETSDDSDDSGDFAEAEESGVSGAVVVAPYPAPYDLVAERRLDDGTRVRLLLGPSYSSEMYGEPVPGSGWQPAPFCYGNREVRITVDGPDVVDVTFGQWYDEPFHEIAVIVQTDVGWADGTPMRLLALQVPEATDEVVVRWDDGITGSAAAAAGVAVVVVDGTDGYATSFEVDLVTGGDVATFTQGDLDPSADPDWRAACVPPPPALPEAGEQPADPDAERAAIGERFEILWDQDTPAEEKPAVLDDRTGVDDAVAAVFEGSFGDVARSAEHRIDEVVFTSPATAWFRYSIDTDNGWFGDRFGVAKLTGDGWIFPRALICQDLALAGGMCEPPTDVIYPPSWYEQNGEQCVYEPDHAEGRCFTYEESEIAGWF